MSLFDKSKPNGWVHEINCILHLNQMEKKKVLLLTTNENADSVRKLMGF